MFIPIILGAVALYPVIYIHHNAFQSNIVIYLIIILMEMIAGMRYTHIYLTYFLFTAGKI